MDRRYCRLWTLVVIGVAGVMFAGCATTGPRAAKTGKAAEIRKTKITRLDDLPQHTYPISGTVTEMVKSDEQVAELARQVRANIEADLEKYEIDDEATVQRMYSKLLSIDLLEGRYDDALVHGRLASASGGLPHPRRPLQP